METVRGFGNTLEILHISDLHLRKGERAKLNFLRGLQRNPVDMVFVTGDIIEDDSGIDCCVQLLRGFRTRIGAFVVFGAHDRWDTRLWNVVRDLSLGGYRKGRPNDFERLRRELERIGVVCLENESHRITLSRHLQSGAAGEGSLWLVGVDDIFAGLDDFEKALAGVPADAFRILLTHAIESPEDLAARRFDAIFAGHSHGGQVRVPFLGPVITRSSLQREYASGVFEVAGTPFHLNNGIGTGRWTGFRFMCPPEATFVELTGSESGNGPR
jgi:predicted MPP superfamily phosphohydrolase